VGQLSVLSGSRDIFKTLITDQPKGQPGLISKAEEEGKGKKVLAVSARVLPKHIKCSNITDKPHSLAENS